MAQVFRDLTDSGERLDFSVGLATTLETLPVIPHSVEQIYYALQLCSLIKPPSAKRLLKKYVFTSVLLPSTMHHARQSLHLLALDVLTAYDVDDDLIEYTWRFARSLRESAHSYKAALVLCRILSHRPDCDHAAFVEMHLLPFVDDEVRATQCTRELASAARRIGFRFLFSFYETIAARTHESARLLIHALNALLLPRDLAETQDAWHALLAALLLARQRPLQPDEIRAIAALEPEVGTPTVLRVLRRLESPSAGHVTTPPQWLLPNTDFLASALIDPADTDRPVLIVPRAVPAKAAPKSHRAPYAYLDANASDTILLMKASAAHNGH